MYLVWYRRLVWKDILLKDGEDILWRRFCIFRVDIIMILRLIWIRLWKLGPIRMEISYLMGLWRLDRGLKRIRFIKRLKRIRTLLILILFRFLVGLVKRIIGFNWEDISRSMQKEILILELYCFSFH